jgi:hydrophobic/amphiphilic exporter-1 (mainly G- bacteria), HAE1 family
MLLADVSIKRPVFTGMLMAALVVFGVFAYQGIGLDMMPNVDVPVATVTTIYPGADPETVEQEVTKKIEEAVSNVAGIDKLKSISVENVSSVILIFDLEVDPAQALQDVRDQVSRVLRELPQDVDPPQVQKLDLNAEAILTLAVQAPGSAADVTRFARKQVKEPLQTMAGVGSVEIVGGQEREVQVLIDPQRLRGAGLSVTDVVQTLAANNLDLPVGRLTTRRAEASVKVQGQIAAVAEIERLKIVERAGRAIRIGDVARVEDGAQERRDAARLNGARAVTVLVRKQSGENSVEVAERVKQRLSQLQQGFAAGHSAQLIVDRTTFTKASFDHVVFDLVLGAFLAVAIVFFFLRNLRSTLIAAAAIPTSVIGTFVFIKFMGFTFNTMTLVALSLSIGLLIDDAIVVLENIMRHMEEGRAPREAASHGAGEIGLAVLATTMSIAAVFLPVAFMQGMTGKFFYEFGLTVAVAVLISLFVSFTLTPMLCSRLLKAPGRPNPLYRLLERGLDALDRGYRRLIAGALRLRWLTVLLALGIFAASLYMAGGTKTEMMASMDTAEIDVQVKLPVGTALAETERVAAEVAQRVRAHEQVLATVTQVGADAQKKQHLGKVYVKLRPKDQRQLGQAELIAALRSELSAVQGAQIQVNPLSFMARESGMSTAIEFNLRGGDLDALARQARAIIAELRQGGGFVAFDVSHEAGKPEVQVQIDRDKAARLGVPTVLVGQTLGALVGGVKATSFRQRGDEVEVRVRLQPSARREAGQLAGLQVRSASGALVDLASLTRIEHGTGPAQIDREQRSRQVVLFATGSDDLAQSEAMARIQAAAKKVLPPDTQTGFGGASAEMKKSFAAMFTALLLAVIIIYMVLASQFESLVHPLTIMIALPLSIPGALGALSLAGLPMSIFAMIGFIMLMGLVTKNSILLVDYTNVLRRRDGLSQREALLKAGPTRLRPILMTTAAMIFGMLPIALGSSMGSELRAPMGIVVIGGLVLSTLLTLLVVPVIYSLLDDLTAWVRRRGRRAAPAEGEAQTLKQSGVEA